MTSHELLSSADRDEKIPAQIHIYTDAAFNLPPIADAGGDQRALEGARVDLDGTGSIAAPGALRRLDRASSAPPAAP